MQLLLYLCLLSATRELFVNADAKHEQIIKDLIVNIGYPFEKHETISDDGYFLTLYRIKHVRSNNIPVLLMHGVMSTPDHFLINGKNSSLGFMLADAGYDVWLGCTRGNSHARRHKTLDPDKGAQFWKYSWHEMGVFDLPAYIDYILERTGRSQLHYIGHSQGTTTFFVMASTRPEYNQKIKSMHALAPVAYFEHNTNLLLKIVDFSEQLVSALWKMHLYEFKLTGMFSKMVLSPMCKKNSFLESICEIAIGIVQGIDHQQYREGLMSTLLRITSPGDSLWQFKHYLQLIKSKRFALFDNGKVINFREYKSIQSPDYELNKITSPVALYYSENDGLAHPKDVENIARSLGNCTLKYNIPLKTFNHIDHMFAKDVKTLLYDKILSVMQGFD